MVFKSVLDLKMVLTQYRAIGSRVGAQGVSDAVETITEILDRGESILITGPAACGKSTLTKQYTHRIATAFLKGTREFVPLLVTVIELAETINVKDHKDTADDLLARYIQRKYASNTALVEFLGVVRGQRKLVLILDGMDEAGAVRGILEPYIGERLAPEVPICLTGRENGIVEMDKFGAFAHFHIQALTKDQQTQIVTCRMETAGVRKGEVTLGERVRLAAWCCDYSRRRAITRTILNFVATVFNVFKALCTRCGLVSITHPGPTDSMTLCIAYRSKPSWARCDAVSVPWARHRCS